IVELEVKDPRRLQFAVRPAQFLVLQAERDLMHLQFEEQLLRVGVGRLHRQRLAGSLPIGLMALVVLALGVVVAGHHGARAPGAGLVRRAVNAAVACVELMPMSAIARSSITLPSLCVAFALLVTLIGVSSKVGLLSPACCRSTLPLIP